ncbi:MAG UNVERIFIED_CONTAM: hypothetical protein LVR18_51155 [Planctomycetaceae bacterium]
MNALLVQGDALLQQRRFAEAVPPLRQLTGLRRLSEDWLILGLAEFQSGDRESGLKSVRKGGSDSAVSSGYPGDTAEAAACCGPALSLSVRLRIARVSAESAG